MILKKIILNNFKSYKGPNEFEFSNGLNIISGTVGSGKTSLFEAFQWLIERKADEFVDSEFILNKSAESDAIQNGTKFIDCEIVLYFENEKKDYTLSKKQVFSITNGLPSASSPEFFLEYVDEITGNSMTEDSPLEVISSISKKFFPQNIREYILFKGENLNELIDFENSNTLRNAVDRISYLKYFEKIYDVTKELKRKIETKYNNNLRADNKKKRAFADAQEKLNNLSSDHKTTIENLERYNVEVKSLQKKKQEYIDILTTLGDYPRLKNELDSKQREKKHALKVGDELSDTLRKSFLQDWLITGFENVIENCEKIFQEFFDEKNKKIEEGKSKLKMGIPGDPIIEQMLQDLNCHFCGRDFQENSNEYETVKSHFDNMKTDLADLLDDSEREMEFRVNDLSSSISTLKFSQKNAVEDFKNYNHKISRNKDAVEQINDEIEDIQSEINSLLKHNSNIKDINSTQIKSSFNSIESDLSKKTKTRDSLERRKVEIEQEIVRQQNNLKNNSSNIEQLKNSPENISKEYVDLIEELAKEQISIEKKSFISQIEQQANGIQETIIQNPNLVVLYSRINPEDYTIDFIDKNGNPNPGHGAQNDLAKLSIISSVLKLSSSKMNQTFPFIVDAPASAFDDTIYKPFIESLSKNFSQSIVILKDIDSEIDYYVAQDYTQKVYQLNKDLTLNDSATMTSSITKIKELK